MMHRPIISDGSGGAKQLVWHNRKAFTTRPRPISSREVYQLAQKLSDLSAAAYSLQFVCQRLYWSTLANFAARALSNDVHRSAR